jgi:hypothetical protein
MADGIMGRRLGEGDERLPAGLEQRTADEWLASIGLQRQCSELASLGSP